MASEVEWAYLAGLIDGEGSIRIEKGSSPHHHSPTTPTVALTNTSSKMIDWVVLKFGGHLYRKTNRTCWDVYWLGKSVIPILEGVLPYLTAKKDQAEVVLAYRKLVGKAGQRISSSDLAKRDIMIEVLGLLKQNDNKVEVK